MPTSLLQPLRTTTIQNNCFSVSIWFIKDKKWYLEQYVVGRENQNA